MLVLIIYTKKINIYHLKDTLLIQNCNPSDQSGLLSENSNIWFLIISIL